MAHIIAIMNHKGGCGKTTSTINLGAALAKAGSSVCLIDLDAQSNLTISLGMQRSSMEQTIGDALLNGAPLQPLHVDKKLDMVPASIQLADVELILATKDDRNTRLKKALEPLLDKYKYILIDCPPSLQVLAVNALAAATAVYVPLQAQYLALQGLAKIEQVVGDVKAALNPAVELAGIFLTQYDSRKTLHKNVAELARMNYPGKVCSTTIRDNVALAEAPIAGQHIYQYSPNSNGAADYMALAKEIAKRIK